MLSLQLPALTWVFLIGTPILISLGQLLFKVVGSRWGPGRPIQEMLLDPYLFGAMVVYAIASFTWIYALRTAPLGLAYTFNALGFIVVPALSLMVFGETLDWRYALGVTLIIAGMLIIHL
ncbi:MAG: SMR family transporter [Pseudomonadota bacterium]